MSQNAVLIVPKHTFVGSLSWIRCSFLESDRAWVGQRSSRDLVGSNNSVNKPAYSGNVSSNHKYLQLQSADSKNCSISPSSNRILWTLSLSLPQKLSSLDFFSEALECEDPPWLECIFLRTDIDCRRIQKVGSTVRKNEFDELELRKRRIGDSTAVTMTQGTNTTDKIFWKTVMVVTTPPMQVTVSDESFEVLKEFWVLPVQRKL